MDESPQLHPAEKKKGMVLDQIARPNFPFPYWSVLEKEPPPLHPIQKEKMMVMVNIIIVSCPTIL